MKKILMFVLSMVVAMSTIDIYSVFAEESGRGLIFVSPDGEDSNTGSMESPLKTFAAAKEKVRKMKREKYPKGITVYFREGNYNFAEAIKFTGEDSGTKEAPVTYRSYNNEKVTFTAGVSLKGSDFSKVTDESVIDRLADKSVASDLLMLDLKKYNISDLGEFKMVGIDSYSSTLVNANILKKVSTPNPEIFIDGKPATLARYPDTGFVETGKIIDAGWSQDHMDRAPVGAPDVFEFKDPRIKKWTKAKPGSILMDGFWVFDWSEQTLPIAEIDAEKMVIKTKWGANFGIEPEKRFYVYNLLEEITVPGEYYIDYDTYVLYILPTNNFLESNISVSILDEDLFQYYGASNIIIKGINITGSRCSFFNFDQNSRDNEVSDSELSFCASFALKALGFNNGIRDSYIHDTDGGVKLEGGDYETLTNGNNYVINCHIERFSRLTATYTPAIHSGGVGILAMNNEINNGPHMAIQIGGSTGRFYYNNIYDVLNGGNDAGAIYGYMNWTLVGNEFKYNRIHDCANPNSRGSTVDGGGIVGFYMDGGLSWNVIVGNIIYDFQGTAYALNGGRNNIVENNIADNVTLAFETTAVMAGGDSANHRRYIEENEKAKPYIYNDYWKERFPVFNKFLYEENSERFKPRDNVVRNNLFLDSTFTIARAQAIIDVWYDMSENYIGNSDPGFENWKERDYNMRNRDKVLKLVPDFKQLPFSRMGKIDKLALARTENAVVLAIDSNEAFVNGKKVYIDENEKVVPIEKNGVSYIPIRFLAEALGAGVDWKDDKVIISTDKINLEFAPGSAEATKNGERITLENPSVTENERTLIPLREISELLEKEVLWFEPGFISVSDEKDLFLKSDETDMNMVKYLYGKINKY